MSIVFLAFVRPKTRKTPRLEDYALENISLVSSTLASKRQEILGIEASALSLARMGTMTAIL
ncbi:uncharacterized protein EAE98_001850 [Botrytis deweyae]|uniref:Uncharacterized protein n=1 Tax=Botrytis deweyae TaxID=2478750 RepID=A0ABQ7IZ08_9HELO|nr:uncharacterized protein EAE98_001850 [Botrytis deweyae]KAF7937536.1 hypothetical protein EAE98_001850 [Botrytis deweyae]